MSEKLLTEMSYDAVNQLLNDYIDRSSEQTGEMPASSFFALLFAKVLQRVKNTLEIEGRIVNGQLVLALPNMATTDLYVQNNQIVIGDQRIVVTLVG